MATLNFKFLSNTKGLNDGIGKSSKALKGFEGTTKKISAGIGKALGGLGIALGAAAIGTALLDAAKAASEERKQQKLLALQLKTTTGANDDQIASAESFIDKLSMASGELDDNLRPALSNAVRGTGSLAKGQELLEIALDGARASGKPLDTVLQALVKANNGNTTALYKLAPQLKKTKGGIDDYAASVKGAAEASADPFARLNVVMENLNERLGTLILPLVEDFANYLIEDVIPVVEQFFDDVDNPNTDTGKVFMVLNETLVGKDGKSGIYGAILGVVDAFGTFFSQISANGNSLDGFVKTIEVLALSLEYAVVQAQNLIKFATNPFAVIDISAQGINYVTRLNEILNRKSLFTNLPTAGTGQTGTSIRGIENFANGGIVLPRPGGTIARIGEAGQAEAVIPLNRLGDFGGNTYVININKANVSGNEIVAAIQRYERGSGRRYLANG
jgi:hypothetical protein